MNTHMTTASDEQTAFPEMARESNEEPETRQLTPDLEDVDREEAGYGYGV